MTPQEMVNRINNLQQTPYEVYFTINEFLDEGNDEGALLYLREYFQCTEALATDTLELYRKTVYSRHRERVERNRASLTPEQIAHANATAREWLNQPKCPTCSSTNLKKISMTSKAVNTAIWGILGTKRHKTFHCNNCGYEW